MEMEERNMEDVRTLNNEVGYVRIAGEVVATVAGIAAMEVEGINSMSGGFVGGIVEVLGKKDLTKGVKVEVGEVETAVSLYVLVDYGYNMADIARKAQEKVKENVEYMTGLKVKKVDVYIQGIVFPKEEVESESVK